MKTKMRRPKISDEPDLHQGIEASRREKVDQALEALMKAVEGADGATFLPPDATVEPGSIVHELYEVWQAQVRGSRREGHSFENLQLWLNEEYGASIPSLQHKLKGRLPIRLREPLEREGLESLVSVLLTHWNATGEGNAEKPTPHPIFENLDKTGRLLAARRIVSGLSTPIYGVSHDTVTITRSPGINTAKFMMDQADAEVILIPVLDRAMYGRDPASALAGTRLSLSYCLGHGKPVRIGWILKAEAQRDTLDYTNYLYERSFLVTLLRLLRIASETGWRDQQNRQIADWPTLKNRLFVCVASDPSGQQSLKAPHLVLDDFVPSRAPQLWKSAREDVTFNKYGFVVVASGLRDGDLEYWLHTKAEIPAFSRLESKVEETMRVAHSRLVSAIVGKAQNANDPLPRPERLPGWQVVSAEEFIRGTDLEPSGSKKEA